MSERKKKHSLKLHISAAVLPSAAFVAVPNAPVPSIIKCIEDAPLMGALLNSTVVSRMFGSPQPDPDENQEQQASIRDYEEMNDKGYLTIPFGELTPDKRSESFIDGMNFTEKAYEFHKKSNESEEINKNSSCLPAPVLEETLLARNCFQTEEIEEDIVHLAEETQTGIFESTEQRSSEELHETEAVNHRREQQLKTEIINLRDIVHRLNIELSKYQAKYCSAQILEQCQNIEGLPTQGPIPSWLISTKYLSPLVMEYGEQIEKLEANLTMYKKEFEKASNYCSELITENENLHEKLDKLTSGSSHVLERSVTEQRIDLLTAENLILLEQIKSEKTKSRDTFYTHSAEIQELKDQLHLKSERCNKLEQELMQEVQKNQELKISLDRLKSENQNKIALTEYENKLSALKKEHNDTIAEHEKAKIDLQTELESCYKDKEMSLSVQAQCKDKIERMHATIKGLKAKTREYEITNRKLLEALKITQNMEYLSQEQMQRFRLNEEVVQKILEKHSKSAEQHKQIKNKLKIYKKKLSDELLCKKEAINNLRQEFEIQIRQLCATLKHKEHLLQISEADRLEMENDMEILWQAAQNENQVMRQILKRISCQCQTRSLLSDDS
ncbi:CEP89 [Acanthosepion pharaonis]|uniref:CEP89 n=1 Tax=Acanthosepion pharaonis TaxID=158019 RepID=A0A812DTE6_ACAPH|nr:CEP89 [Sepia pharaonis]